MTRQHDDARVRRLDIVARLADDLAHEIKNPLNSMVITLELMRARVRRNDVDGVIERADVLEGEIRRLNGLVDAFLRLLRPDRSGKTGVALASVLEELTPLLVAKAKLARVQLRIGDMPGDALIHAERDALRFAVLHGIVAELDRAADDSPVAIEGELTEAGVRITVSAARNADGDAPDPLDEARLLIEAVGGSLAETIDGDRRVVAISFPPPPSA